VDVGPDRVRRLAELARDALAVEAADHQRKDLLLSGGELVEEPTASRLGRVGDLGQHVVQQAGRQPAAAEDRRPHGGDDVLRRRVLRHEPDGAGADRADRGGGVRIGGEHHDERRRRQRHQLRGEVDPADPAEADIHDHRVRLRRHRDVDDPIRVADRLQRLHARLRAEDSLKALTEDAVIIDDEQPDGH
jgi:hypothetical protein